MFNCSNVGGQILVSDVGIEVWGQSKFKNSLKIKLIKQLILVKQNVHVYV